MCHLVGHLQVWQGVAGASHTKQVWHCQKQSACWLQTESRVQSESGCSPGRLSESLTVHHGSGIPLMKSFIHDVPEETWCAYDVFIIFQSLEQFREKLMLWKANTEGEGLRVNMDKTKVLIPKLGLDVHHSSDKDPCAMCLKGVVTNSIFCRIVYTRDAVVSLAFWSLIPASRIKYVLDISD